ncbi:MAG: ribosome biogenesis GTP-binding protein YihA/YsxC [Proteobacteria bacterium]|nr:YihA family ribosome biogenesis GTP-binding protein [Desulfobulbaceae bacterium]MBU4152386.1 ribosome biogenesis GTP-binding protein YihA/YsxC [Pseudomonadota bacterium]MDP2105273.1 ribosome biogenesis GTP-binding protein YihA/YsxC [Desulfobulbaceae bacterium]
MAINYSEVEFLISAYALKQLPEPEYPEIAFAGRSNVGKSSLMNRLLNRRNLVKVSAKPGKTQSLNYFTVDNALYLVDLPGYGYAKVPKAVKGLWQGLISDYIESRKTLCCVVVIIDIRHPLKELDLELVNWLREVCVPYLLVYTKLDKITRGQRYQHAAALDAGLTVAPSERVLFSSQTGEGRDELIARLEGFMAATRDNK